MNKDEILGAMYAQNEEPVEKRPQPEQLRLAGKATITTVNERQIAIPRIEYVEGLENRLVRAERLIEEQAAAIKKLMFRLDRNANIAQRQINAVESSVQSVKNNRTPFG